MGKEGPDLLQGTLDMLVLQALTAGPKHGYAVAHWIEDRTTDVLSIEEGSLYPALHRMQKRGWIESSWGVSENNRRAKYYRLTAVGRRQLRSETVQWKRFVEAVTLVLRPVEGGS
ncbi:MAG: PadR family transcriptional regulator [Candidatus Palauibacterales bacterium]|jgi:PadR family transcriptional regulator|nr:PadR family transcriptional regulator [Candidatus Palauibacterales bacterium]